MDLCLHGIIIDENFMFDIIPITVFIIVVVGCDSVGFFVFVGPSFNLASDAVGLWGALSSHGLFGLAPFDIEKLISALEISGGSKTDACTHGWNLCVSLRGIQFIKNLPV